MAEIPMSPIEPRSVSAQKPLHARHEIRSGCLNHQLKVIVHEAIGMDLPTALLASRSEGFKKQLAVLI
jgi:hypothetical protein